MMSGPVCASLNGLFMGLSCDRMTCGTLAPRWLLADHIRNMPPSWSGPKWGERNRRSTSPNECGAMHDAAADSRVVVERGGMQ
ncbi:hypothetical protein F2P81_001842 [Scophthalmus maximus]|uniref:Uncharacterized protein n=1 Tax=Scophthalmus maximus TaxID=52904 RepID=A0A6A4TH87_SCOMX|nr:hypothetical protein F2P81_001842 [Scophthalmus maximus]